MPSVTYRHPYGLKAEIDIQPRTVGASSPAQQTVRIEVAKTCESITAWCCGSSSNDWVMFDSQLRWRLWFDPQESTRSRFRAWTLPLIECVIALAPGIATPKDDPESVTVWIEVKADGELPAGKEENGAIINLRIV